MAAVLTGARLLRDTGDVVGAEQAFVEAAALAKESGSAGRVRDVLREWADLRATAGDHRGAYELSREALSVN